MSETKRVTMLWPEDLKGRVRAKVGDRGLTAFTLEAVAIHLQDSDRQKELEKEVNELKYLAQLLADRAAMGGDHQERRAALMEVELPHWIETQGWPADLAELVRPEVIALPDDPQPNADAAPEVESKGEPIALSGEPKTGESSAPPEPTTPSSELPHDRGAGDDFLSRVMGKAAEKGVDLGAVPLKRASEIEKPAPRERTSVPGEALPDMDPSSYPVDATPLPERVEPKADACPKCGDELVAGECWTCP